MVALAYLKIRELEDWTAIKQKYTSTKQKLGQNITTNFKIVAKGNCTKSLSLRQTNNLGMPQGILTM